MYSFFIYKTNIAQTISKTVKFLSVLPVSVTLRAKIMDRNVALVYMVCPYIGFVHKNNIITAQNEQH